MVGESQDEMELNIKLHPSVEPRSITVLSDPSATETLGFTFSLKSVLSFSGGISSSEVTRCRYVGF